LSGSTLYGTTRLGGSSGSGTVFAVNTNGTGYTVLKNFTSSDGAHRSRLDIVRSTLYSTTQFGGNFGSGRSSRSAQMAAATRAETFTLFNSDAVIERGPDVIRQHAIRTTYSGAVTIRERYSG